MGWNKRFDQIIKSLIIYKKAQMADYKNMTLKVIKMYRYPDRSVCFECLKKNGMPKAAILIAGISHGGRPKIIFTLDSIINSNYAIMREINKKFESLELETDHAEKFILKAIGIKKDGSREVIFIDDDRYVEIKNTVV